MMNRKLKISEPLLIEFSQFLSESFGLSFPKEKYNDLDRGVNDIMPLLNETDPSECIHHLKSRPLTNAQIEILTMHFTVGETYFFREPGYFKALQYQILPKIIERRQQTEKRLRIWSAGCSTGEEPYSIAILLSKLIDDLSQWNITILATDINLSALQKLKVGIYSEWSFRGVPDDIREHYFKKQSPNRYEILPFIKKMVSPNYLNLAFDKYPSLINNTNAMDIIFCRNLLMYFVPGLTSNIIVRLKQSLIEGGALVVGASDLSLVPHHLFSEYRVQDAIFFVKGHFESLMHEMDFETSLKDFASDVSEGNEGSEEAKETEVTEVTEVPEKSEEPEESEEPQKENVYNSSEICFPDFGDIKLANIEMDKGYDKNKNKEIEKLTVTETESLENRCRLMANQGKLNESLALIDQGLTIDKCNIMLHYLKALVLQELGSLESAVNELKKSLYLDPNFVLAYFALGNIAANQKQWQVAKNYYSIVLNLSNQYKAEEELPGSEGCITAERMREIIYSKNLMI